MENCMHNISKIKNGAFIVVQLVIVNICTDCKQYHLSVKCPKISRWLLRHDPLTSICYYDISRKICSEIAGDPNRYHFCWPKLGVMTTCHYSYLKNIGCMLSETRGLKFFLFEIRWCMLFKFLPVSLLVHGSLLVQTPFNPCRGFVEDTGIYDGI